jgi:SAM-dependent methyltransferase
LLDIGCSGGGLVKSVLDGGGFAVGVEGSDYSLKRKRAEWATIPGHLFTADATEPFQLSEIDESGSKTPLTFNVITAWEFFEHIPEQGLAPIVKNILNHLAPRGIVMASIATYPDVVNGVALHQTIHMRPWWVKTFAWLGFERQEEIEKYFGFDMVRGLPLSYDSSFTIALTRVGESPDDPQRIHELARAETTDRVLKTLKWCLAPMNWKRHAWYLKRTVESRLPGGRPFPY